MVKQRFGKAAAVAAGLVLLTAVPRRSHAQSASSTAVQASKPSSSVSHAQSLADAFGGLTYTDEQKEAIDKIRKETASHKEAVMKDTKLSADQRDAMLTGYDRLEYGFIFKVLTPNQQRQVQMKLHANQGADQAAPGKK